MAGNKKNIDQLFKEGLNQTNYEVPPVFLDDLEKKLDGMHKKRFGGFFWSVFLIGLLNFTLIGFLFFSYFNDEQALKEPVYQAVLLEEESNINSEAQLNVEESSGVHFDEEEGTPKGGSGSEMNNEISSEHPEALPQETDSKNDVLIPVKSTGKPHITSVSEPSKEQVRPKVKVKPNDRRKVNIDNAELIAFEAKKAESKIEDTEEVIAIHEEQQPHEGESDKTTTPEMVNKEIDKLTFEDSEEELEVKTESEEAQTQAEEEVEEGKTLLLAEEVDSLLNKEAAEELPQLGTIALEVEVSPLLFDIQVYGGIGSVFYRDKFSGTTQSEVLGDIEDGRKMMVVPSVGANLNFNFKKWTFGVGAEYMQTGERFSFDQSILSSYDTTFVYTDTVTELISYYQPYGDWIYDTVVENIETTVEDAVITDTTLEKMQITNRYSWISVPVSFGYRFEVGKFEVIPSLGAQLNVGIAQNKGRYPGENFENIIELNANQFNISYLGQIEVRRNFTNWHVFVRPYFKSMITPAIKEGVLQRKYSNWGVNVGVGFKL